MKKLITDIQNRLIDQVADLKYVDMDWGQLDFYNPHPPVKWPCALIDLGGAQWTNAAELAQTGLITIVITIADLRLTNSSGKAPQGQKDRAMKIFDILKDIHKALHGWTGDKAYSSLIRQSNGRSRREDGVQLYQIIFTTELTDDTAMKKYDKKPATPKPIIKLL